MPKEPHTLATHAMCERTTAPAPPHPRPSKRLTLLPKEGGLEVEIVAFDFRDMWGHFREDSCGGRRLIWTGQ